MNMIHNFEDFSRLNKQNKIKPDVKSGLGSKSVECLRKLGWKIGKNTESKDLLNICSQSEENFKMAHQHCGIDFWVIDK